MEQQTAFPVHQRTPMRTQGRVSQEGILPGGLQWRRPLRRDFRREPHRARLRQHCCQSIHPLKRIKPARM